MKLTAKQKQAIRQHYSYMPLKFSKDGTVRAKKGNCWGVLYNPCDTEKHLKAIGLM